MDGVSGVEEGVECFNVLPGIAAFTGPKPPFDDGGGGGGDGGVGGHRKIKGKTTI